MDEKDYIMLDYIHREKSITKAAELLFTSQPSLSYRLKQIENDLGVKILVRAGRDIEFTPEGEYLVLFAKEMLKKLNNFRDELYNISSNPRGNLRLAVTNITARYYLPKILKKYTNKFPNINIHITTGKSADVLDLLENKEVHVCILRGDYHWEGVKHLIGSEDICLISKKPINLDDLPYLPQIYYNDQKYQNNFNKNTSLYNEFSYTKQIQNWWFQRFNEPPSYNIEVGGAETCKEMVVNGLGYAFVPQLFINKNDDLFIKKLTLANGDVISRNTWLLYRKSSLHLDFIKSFVNEFNIIKTISS